MIKADRAAIAETSRTTEERPALVWRLIARAVCAVRGHDDEMIRSKRWRLRCRRCRRATSGV